MDLKIPKALKTVFSITVTASNFRDMTSGAKLKKIIKEHV